MSDCVDVVMLAKAGEAYGAAEIRDLSALLVGLNHRITIQPIIEHPKSLKIAPELMQYATVQPRRVRHPRLLQGDGHPHHAASTGPRSCSFYLNQVLFEARIAGKGVIGGVETLIGQATMPETFVEHARRAPLARPARRRGVARRLPARLRGGLAWASPASR